MFNQPHFLHPLLIIIYSAAVAFPGDRETFGVEQNLPAGLEETYNSCPLTHECISKVECKTYPGNLINLTDSVIVIVLNS